MRIFVVSLLLLLASLVSGYGDGIIVLDKNNFDDVLSQVKYVMVEFYLPGCISCKNFAHEYAKAAQSMAIIYPHIKFFEVDGNTEESLVKRYNIQKFPTTKFFVKGSKTPFEYDGARNADDIVAWVKDKYAKVSVEIQTQKEAQKYISDNNIVGLFVGSPESNDYKTFSEVAQHFDDVIFITSDSQELRDTYGLKDGESQFILFKQFDERKNVYNGLFTPEDLGGFVRLQKFQSVMPFDQKAIQRIFYEGGEAIFLFKSKDSKNEEVEEAFKAVARDLKDKFAMTIVDFEDELELPVTDLLSIPLNQILLVNKNELPSLRLIQPRNRMSRYSLEGPITPQNIKSFVDDVENNRLKPLLASAPVPSKPYEGDVRVLVGKNFNDVVLESGQDVLVLFCNRNHDVCKNFEPVYSEIATKLKSMSNIIVAKIDTSENEVQGVRMRSTVDLKFYPGIRKTNPVDYSGNMEASSILTFIGENTGVLGM